MADYKLQLIEDVTLSLTGKLDRDDIGTVSDEMAIALRDYEVTKRITDLVKYDGANELIVKRYKACLLIAGKSPVEVLLSTGVRVSELCSICLSDINFDALSIKVREGKGSKQRTVYMNDLAKKHLLAYLTSRNVDGEYLFYNKQKAPLNPGGVRHILKVLEGRAEITNIHPHRFRRTFATGLANRGMEVQEIAKLLGHANINTTLEYVYTSDEKVMQSYRKYIA